jgi:hypothetical protein
MIKEGGENVDGRACGTLRNLKRSAEISLRSIEIAFLFFPLATSRRQVAKSCNTGGGCVTNNRLELISAKLRNYPSPSSITTYHIIKGFRPGLHQDERLRHI